MTAKHFLLFAFASAFVQLARAQDAKIDSAATTLKSLLVVRKQVDFADLETTKLGTFYKAASYIV